LVYVVSNLNKLWSYNVATNTFALVKDFSALLPGEYQWQMHRSLDDDKFSWTRRKASDYSVLGYAVYSRAQNQIIYQADLGPTDLDEVQLDKTGRYLVVKLDHHGAGVVESQIVDLQTQHVTELVDDAPDYDAGHSDNGSGTQ